MEGFSFTDTVLSLSFLSVLAVLGTGMLAFIPILAAGSALGFFKFGWQTFADLFRKLPEREKSWGTVYDAVTLKPIPFAVLQLLGPDRRILEKRVADKDGRFGFLVTPASLNTDSVTVRLTVRAAGYTFPSVAAEGMARVIYGHIYKGEQVTVHENEIINADVPMDPLKNNQVTIAEKAPSVQVGIASAAMADAGLWVGLLAVPLALFLNPNYFSMGILFVFLGVASMRIFGIAKHPYGTVIDSERKAIPYALITVHNDDGNRIAYAVSDEHGRYVLSIPHGSYVMTVRTPANIRPPRQTEASIAPRKGWITKEVVI